MESSFPSNWNSPENHSCKPKPTTPSSPTILWMDGILHHFDGKALFVGIYRESASQALLGGAKWISQPSTVFLGCSPFSSVGSELLRPFRDSCKLGGGGFRIRGRPQKSRGTFHFHSFQGSFFLENLRKPRENGSGVWTERWLKRMGKESTPKINSF